MYGAKPVKLGRQGSAVAPVAGQSRVERPEQSLPHLAEGVLAQHMPRLEAFQSVDLPERPRQVHVAAPSGEARAEKSPSSTRKKLSGFSAPVLAGARNGGRWPRTSSARR